MATRSFRNNWVRYMESATATSPWLPPGGSCHDEISASRNRYFVVTDEGGDRLVNKCNWMSGICSRLHHSTYCCGDFKRSPPLISQPCRFRSAVKSGSFPPGEAKNSEDFGEYHTSKHSVAWKAAAPLGSPIRRPLQLAVQNHNVLPFNLRHSLSQRESRGGFAARVAC